MPLSCGTCEVVFENSETHKTHFKSEWHRYNLKRKIAELSTVTFDEFKERASAYQKATEPPCEKTLTCKPCHKNFSSENALQSHLKSKRHIEIAGKKSLTEVVKNIKNKSANEVNRQFLNENRENDDAAVLLQPVSDDETATDDDDDWESVDDEDIPVVPTNICMFCNSESSDTEANIQHMKTVHSFYIPDTEYLINREGLLCYLGQKVCFGFTCLSCNLQKRSVRSVQQHMIDKGHCRMNYEGNSMEEYEDFYDYTTSYPDHTENPGEEALVDVLESDGYQLNLPSGSTIGHRSLALYYRQNLKPVKDGASKTARIMHKYRAICEGGTVGYLALYKTKAYKYALQRQRRSSLKLCLKKNKFQPHFRSQIMF